MATTLPQPARQSRFIYAPEVHRSKERTKATLTSIITPFFESLHSLYNGPRYGFPPGEIGVALRNSLDLVQSHYIRRLLAHFFISPASEHRIAILKLRQAFQSLEDIFMEEAIEIEMCGHLAPTNRDFPTIRTFPPNNFLTNDNNLPTVPTVPSSNTLPTLPSNNFPSILTTTNNSNLNINKAIKAATRARARAKKHDTRWQDMLAFMAVEKTLKDMETLWPEMSLENFMEVMTDYMVFVLSLNLGQVEREREVRELRKVENVEGQKGGNMNMKRMRRKSCFF
ncbi:hypothetical protein SMACR_12606 [Sordaria macrospora]|uniref:Uncharacterized protein n=1 Tax=Sordaria macrospora TaxID=5147 RepID=A0A8S8ZLN8_SORMA|nr:hypothetical protein SMACR_12606 [Sordaria macrospora]WPJ62775.1 hypothetical protein SMAC4_12606 [Sordaria macrospora]